MGVARRFLVHLKKGNKTRILVIRRHFHPSFSLPIFARVSTVAKYSVRSSSGLSRPEVQFRSFGAFFDFARTTTRTFFRGRPGGRFSSDRVAFDGTPPTSGGSLITGSLVASLGYCGSSMSSSSATETSDDSAASSTGFSRREARF